MLDQIVRFARHRTVGQVPFRLSSLRDIFFVTVGFADSDVTNAAFA